MSIFRRKSGFEFAPLPKLPKYSFGEPISHIRIIEQSTPGQSSKVFDWEKEAPELADPETQTNDAQNLAPVIGSIGVNAFEQDGSINPMVVNYLQEGPSAQPGSDLSNTEII
ncbi:hypothetical protein KC968_03980 [Candidatus Saccharibacteria bacterium]|nr:hypothetical protein [Candidatus Saccharibacteria bacterium]